MRKACGTRGDAVGAQLGADPVKRFTVNMGTVITLPATSRAVRCRESSSSADGVVAGRSPRSSPRAGKPSTWRKGGSEFAGRLWNGRRSPVNTDASWPTAELAKARVLRIQTKLHQWATDDPDRRFDDLYNLVDDPAVLVDAWARVRSNRGALLGRGGRAYRSSHHDRCGRARLPCRSCEMISRPAGFAREAVREGDDPQARRQISPAGHRDRARPGGAGRSQDGARAGSRQATRWVVPAGAVSDTERGDGDASARRPATGWW